jgi:serine/threonine-protein kinase
MTFFVTFAERLWRVLFWFAITTTWITAPARGQVEGDVVENLEGQAFKVLQKHCAACHGDQVPGFDVSDLEGMKKKAYIVPGDLDSSFLWVRAGIRKDMPPKESVDAMPADEELAVLEEWIKSGAKAPVFSRAIVTESEILQRISDYVDQHVDAADEPFTKFFSLAHLHNNPNVSTRDLRLYRAAFSKLLNSLSRERIFVPKLIDAQPDNPDSGLIFVADIRRDVTWDVEDWKKLLRNYPYGVTWSEPRIQQRTERVLTRLGGNLLADGVPYVRVDWFIYNASRPPFYHDFLDLPDHVNKLEAVLGVDVLKDFRDNKLMRAGFSESGVSYFNRLVDRHEPRNAGYYYRSYDFSQDHGRAVLSRFPLGPRFNGSPFDEHAFEHAGGEMFYQLKNGLQAYLLADAEGKRIDNGPIELVRDVDESSGTPRVVNGISCIGCHKEGIRPYSDSVRRYTGLSHQSRDKVDAIYRDEDLQAELKADRADFVAALEQCMGPFLKVKEDENEKITAFPEPVSWAANQYTRDLDVRSVAAELSFFTETPLTPQRVEEDVRASRELQRRGLGPLGEGRKIARQLWDSMDESGISLFQAVISAKGLGSPRGG